MSGRESKWSWLSPERVLSKVAPGHRHAHDPRSSAEEEENPWMTLQQNQQTNRSDSKSNWETMPSASHEGSSPTARWLGEETSPYGFSDDDGTLKQVDSANWRRNLAKKRPQQFVPAGRTPSTRWQGGPSNGRSGAVGKRTTSTWMFQMVCAVVLVGGALYAHQSGSPTAQKVQSVFKDMFQQDYSQSALPAVQHFFDAHHISVPAFGSAGAIQLHAPLNGTIQTDYATTHPEMVIIGSKKGGVTAAGSGTVNKVVKLSDGTMITINHGSLGTSVYIGLADSSVHESEYVSAGQLIGHLQNLDHPVLKFALEKDGHYVDPHDEIHFSSSGV